MMNILKIEIEKSRKTKDQDFIARLRDKDLYWPLNLIIKNHLS